MASPLQKQVYQAYLEAGLSPNQARIITAEVGRENSFNPQNIFGVHSDPKNGAANLGMLSWQGDRGNALYKELRSKGMIKGNQITPTQDALNQMARFSVNEMRTNKNYQQTARTFLGNPNVDYQTGSAVLGRNYIRWRYDDPQYQSGHRNRDKFYQAMGGGSQQQALQPQGLTVQQLTAKYGKPKQVDSSIFGQQPQQPQGLTVQALTAKYGQPKAVDSSVFGGQSQSAGLTVQELTSKYGAPKQVDLSALGKV